MHPEFNNLVKRMMELGAMFLFNERGAAARLGKGEIMMIRRAESGGCLVPVECRFIKPRKRKG